MKWDAKFIGGILVFLVSLGTGVRYMYERVEDYSFLKAEKEFRYANDSLKLSVMELTINCSGRND